jgi:hypothetical protein
MADWLKRATPVEDTAPPPWLKKATPVPQGAGAVAMDVAKSTGTGLAEGAIAVLGMPEDLRRLGQRGFNAAADYIGDKVGSLFGVAPTSPQERARREAIFTGRNLPVSSGDIKGGVEKVTGDFYKPQTTAGQYANTVAQFVPGAAINPTGSVASNVLNYGVLPGLASEAAGQLSAGTAAEPYARGAAAVATSLVSAGRQRPAYAERTVGRAAQGVTQQQFDDASRLVADAQARGIMLTPAEALEQVTGGGTRLGVIQRQAEALDDTNRLSGAFAARPGQMRAATDTALDQVAPRSAQPQFQAVQAQEAAQGALDTTRQNINKMAQPYYDATRNQVIPAQDLARLQANPSYAAALAEVRNNAELAPLLAGQADDSVSVVNEVVKRLDRGATAAKQTQLNPQGDNALAAVRTGARVDADNIARAASSEYGQARQIVADGNERVLGPLKAGPVGQIAATDDVAAQGSALLSKTASPQEVQRATAVLPNQTARGVVREELGRTADKTVGGLDNMGRPDQYGGSKFAREMRGNAREAGNINAAITGAAGQPVADDINRLVDVLQATGMRQRPGSATAFNENFMNEMRRGGVRGVIDALVRPLGKAGEAVQQSRLASQSEKLADLLLSGPDGVRRIQELAARGDDRARILARLLLSQQAATSPAP